MKVEEHIPLASYTTFHLGGPARYFIRVGTVDELREAVEFSKSQNFKILILGGGSNLLITEKGFDGVVIKIEIAGVERQGNTLVGGAGESWDGLVAYAVKEGLWGLENLSGIPGTVGGAVVQGIGAYGAAVGQTIEWVDVYDCETSEVKKMTAAECVFDYRTSFFKHDNARHIVLRATFKLSDVSTPNISYKDIAERLGSSVPSLEDVRNTVLTIRKGKFPNLTEEGTAGSFFKNLIMMPAEAKKLTDLYPLMPIFAMPETAGFKVPLAWLLDHALGLKGKRVGGARLFEKQPLVVTADKNATAQDVLSLVQEVERSVKEKLNLIIEREVKVIS